LKLDTLNGIMIKSEKNAGRYKNFIIDCKFSLAGVKLNKIKHGSALQKEKGD